jgi:hypothetical protein
VKCGNSEESNRYDFALQFADNVQCESSFATLNERNLVIVVKKQTSDFWWSVFEKQKNDND